MHPASTMYQQRGTSMIEVLVTIVILTFGLLGLVGLQSRLQLSEVEAYQRAQALILLDDMANRIATNRNFAASYETGTDQPLGTGNAICTVDSNTARQTQDSCEWNNALLGAAEVSDTSRVGAMVGARGCIEAVAGTINEYMVTVAWQGMGPISKPPANVACGQGNYDGTGNSVCTDDRCRRVLTTLVRIAPLS